MPGGDRTGPQGIGPRTGRAAGLCAGFQQPGYMNAAWGRNTGRGGGFGGGRGRRNCYYATGLPRWARFQAYGTPSVPEVAAETEGLKAQADMLQAQVDQINRRIAEIEAKSK